MFDFLNEDLRGFGYLTFVSFSGMAPGSGSLYFLKMCRNPWHWKQPGQSRIIGFQRHG